MSKLSKKLLGLLSGTGQAGDTSTVVSTDVATTEPAATSEASWIGLRDAVTSGWYQNATGELFRGVPIGPDDTVVDVGCGDGGSSLFCARFGAHVTAVDIDPEVVAAIGPRLEALIPGKYATLLSDASPLPLPDGVASRVICTEVLEHVADPDQVLSELFRIGKPGALYLLTVPDELQEKLQQQVAPSVYFQHPNHIRIIGRDQFEPMVKRAGLEVIEHTQYGFYWAIWWAMFWACKVDLDSPRHPALDHWAAAWQALMDLPDGETYKKKLDAFLPKSRVIVARKPEAST